MVLVGVSMDRLYIGVCGAGVGVTGCFYVRMFKYGVDVTDWINGFWHDVDISFG